MIEKSIRIAEQSSIDFFFNYILKNYSNNIFEK